jgi:RNA polymerase sigma-70 factor (ECF subfamily)
LEANLYISNLGQQKLIKHPISIERLKAKDNQEQHKAYKYLYGKMIGIPLRYTQSKSDAQDILNAAFFKVFDSIGRYIEQGDFTGWVAKIVFNTTIDHVRKSIKYKDNVSLDKAPVVQVHNKALEQMGLEEINACIQKLPKSSQVVFSLYVVDGFSHKEISNILSISEGTSKWHLNNARTKLQDFFNKL